MDVLDKVKREAARQVEAEERFSAAVRAASERGASLRMIEAAVREAVGARHGFGRETLRAIVKGGTDAG